MLTPPGRLERGRGRRRLAVGDGCGATPKGDGGRGDMTRVRLAAAAAADEYARQCSPSQRVSSWEPSTPLPPPPRAACEPLEMASLTGGFDVYNIETAMPKIDLDAIESHLRAAREEERRG
ncbi:Uncharacterized protein GBIM_00215 [Gryllus bimaculatus]|nr:Uncharacterized protein GBIM_00215 [Gryllus bimaculatus]